MRRFPRSFLFILFTLLIDAVGIGIVFPIMPDLMERVGAADVARASVWAGLLMAAYAGAQFIFAPIVGSVSDAYGRKPVLLGALAFLAVDYVIMALAGGLGILLVGRFLAGLAGATYITATAYVADLSKPGDRAANFGMIGAAFGVGFVLGPMLGGLVATVHVTAPFWLAAGLAAANFLFGLAVLPESLSPDKRRPFGRRDINPFGAIAQALRLPGLAVPLACLFLFEFAGMSYATLWAFWGREVFAWSTLVIGLTLSAYGALAAGVQAGLMPVAIRMIGERRLMIAGLVASLISFVGLGFIREAWMVAVFLPIAALSDLVPPTMTAMAANTAPEDRQGLLQGVIASLASVAAIVAPLLFTAVFDRFAGPGAEVYLPGAPFLLGALLVAVILPLAIFGNRAGRAGQAAE